MNETVITEINIYPVRPKDGLVAFASCLLDGKLSLNSIAIYTRPDGNGHRLVYPAKMLPNGKLINLFYPIDKTTASIIQQAIISDYENLIDKVTKGVFQNEQPTMFPTSVGK
jgi:DNA-binding cell septation regulator SpoVG